ncbi:aldo/keto reductase [Streptococcus equinus]|uniref:aldo/keto reductase n=1 Tax=Streptococcus equinus TaxID=1335 RepID=UPI0008AF0B1E|nr:aldo/keto reductase [Streptococcus equinus]SEI55422.1 Aldo/keto reductase [Streptococcus equinus]
MNQTYLTLNTGYKMPQFGIGVYMVAPSDTKKNLLDAFSLGYRHIDTAHAYQNEREVGQAVTESGISRDEIFVTSKLWPSDYADSNAIDKMLHRLDLDYIDLVLLHQEIGDYKAGWKNLEKAVRDGKVRSIGLSNFESERLEEILDMATIQPAALQVECHPYFQQVDLRERISKVGTIIESWYPLGHGDSGLLNEPIFTKLAKKYHKTNAQIILRWHIQVGNAVFPKTTNPEHMKENIDIFDFELSPDEMTKIQKLDSGKRYFNMTLEEREKNLGAWRPAD